jgi:hypothetical protein
MSDTTPNLNLPYIMPAQAQKHVTHNEAIRTLDCLVQLTVVSRLLSAPPATPADGACYIVAAAPTAAWTGQAGKIAVFQDGAWSFHAPREGWRAWIAGEDILAVWTGTAWIAAAISSLNPVPLVGINATADATNRLAVSAPATLLNHSGNGHQLKLNKAAATDTASQLFQTGFSGRAEFGLTGDDDLHVKVSADGGTWREALVVTAATGTPRVPSLPKATLPSAAIAGAGALVHVPDEAGGAVLAFSDATNWRRVTDRAIVS